MGRLIGIALRNVLRNKWRSAVSMIALFIGVGAVVFLQGFTNGFLKAMIEDAVFAKVGAIQIHRTGYVDAEQDPLKLDLADDPALVAKLRAIPGVRAVSRRIAFDGQMTNGSISSMFMATAIDPKTEYEVCPRRREQVAKDSTPLDGKLPNEVLMGDAFAEGLDAKKGATLTITSATQSGASNALDVTVHGMLPVGQIVESKRGVLVTLALAQDLLRMEGRVTEYVLNVEDLDRVEETADLVRKALGDGYQLNTWRDLPQIHDAMQRMKYVMGFIIIVLALLVASGIVNTVMMSVYERVREIGTMLAVGVRRIQVLWLFLVEAAALGLLGAVPGAAIGWTVLHQFSKGGGIHFPGPGGAAGFIITPFVSVNFIVDAIVLAIIGALMAALYPSWKASRLSPVEALRSN